MKNEVSIKYIWWIDDKEKWINLTGSSTLMTVDLWNSKVRILTDIWIFQWWKIAEEANSQIDENAIKADYVIITHAHMDHIGRLPMLVKKWFSWKILMSSTTKNLGRHMLESYVVLTRRMIEEQEEWQKKKWQQLKEYFRAVKEYEELQNNTNLNKKDRKSKNDFLNRLKWTTSFSLIDFIFFAKAQLVKNNILKESDIAKAIWWNDIELLYEEDDIVKTLSMIHTLEVWEDIDLDTRIIISSLDDERIDEEIPKMVKAAYNKKIYVLPHLKQAIINKWKKTLNDISKINKENKNLREKLLEALNFVNDKNNQKNDLYSEKQKLLEAHNIKTKADIEAIKESCLLFPFSKDDILIFSNLLEPVFTKDNQKVIEAFKLRFFDAGHIEWSVQAVVTLVTKKVEHALNTSTFNAPFKKEHTNFLLSWDLWKFTDPNLSGVPDIPPFKFDYVQIESTYADRNHPDKQEDFKKFLYELNSTVWKTLVAAFSLQRTQEIILELLQNKADNRPLYDQFKPLKKWLKPFKERFLILEKIENPSEEEINEKIRLAGIINAINDQITIVQENIFTWNIVLDSPLSERLNSVFTTKLWDKYALLKTEIQLAIFWKELVRVLERWEYRDLYKPERIKSKEVIVSSGWMLQWWSIINHLKNIIDDPDAKIIFTGYQAEWTLWSEILSWKKQILIDNNLYDVKCKVVQIKWYSSHIWKDDLIEYTTKKLTYSKKAKLALTHWNESREVLAKEIRKVKSNIDVIIPKLWDEIKIKI